MNRNYAPIYISINTVCHSGIAIVSTYGAGAVVVAVGLTFIFLDY